MTIIRIEKTQNYTCIANEILRDSRLSFEARGVAAYLLTMPDGWQINSNQLAQQSPAGATVIRRVLRELDKTGYLTRQRHRSNGGTFFWERVLSEVPKDTKSTTGGFTTSGSPTRGEPTYILSTESISTKSIEASPQVADKLPPQAPAAGLEQQPTALPQNWYEKDSGDTAVESSSNSTFSGDNQLPPVLIGTKKRGERKVVVKTTAPSPPPTPPLPPAPFPLFELPEPSLPQTLPAKKKQPTAQQAMLAAICTTLDVDIKIKRVASIYGAIASELTKAGYTPEDVSYWVEHLWPSHWTYKNGRPSSKTLVEGIAEAKRKRETGPERKTSRWDGIKRLDE